MFEKRYIILYIRFNTTEQNRTNFISNVYIVHSFQHLHIQHITHVIKAEKKKKVEKSRKKERQKVVISQFGESK